MHASLDTIIGEEVYRGGFCLAPQECRDAVRELYVLEHKGRVYRLSPPGPAHFLYSGICLHESQKEEEGMAPKRYWLMKSEPSTFSIDDLARSSNQTTCWDGVRNYQARNFMRSMAVGDQVLFYHSNTDPPAVVGTAEVVKTAYHDSTQFDKRNKHYDSESKPAKPRWDMVDIRYVRKFARPLTLDELRAQIKLKDMPLLKKGSRLSVQPVTLLEWRHIISLV